MNGSKAVLRITFFCILVHAEAPLQSQQNEGWIDAAEETMNRAADPGLAEDHCEVNQDLLSHPVNLNDATLAQLESCGLFTSYQVHSILRYREEYGNLLSLYELAALPGFRRAWLEEQSIYMTVHKSSFPLKPVKATPGMLLLYLGKGHTEPDNQAIYPGPPWKTSLRIKKGLGARLTAGLAYEKDQGEKAFWGYRPEHLCGYLEWQGRRSLEQLLVGNFRINIGMGLVQGAGIMHTPQGVHSRPILLSTLKPYAGAAESLLHQGVACKLNLGVIRLMLWSSFQSLDLSLSEYNIPGKATDWANHIRESGYHRSATELAGRNLAYLGSTGIQVVASWGRLNLGMQYSPEINGLTGRGRDSLQYHERPVIYHASSLQWQWRLDKLELYGEFAPWLNKSPAFLAGGRFHINDFLSGTAQLHWYGVSRREAFASAYASGSHVKNEGGLLLLIHAEPFGGIRADVVTEVFSHPAPRTLVNVPSSGFRLSLTLQNGSQEIVHWRFLMVNTSRQQSLPFDQPGIRPLGSIQNSRIDGRVIYMPARWFSFQSRLVISFDPAKPGENGHAALQQLGLRFNKRFKCSARLVLYRIPSWDMRIYLHEPGLYQQFRFPVYSGTGSKISIMTSVKAGRRISLEAKGAVNREKEKKRWDAELQLRLDI